MRRVALRACATTSMKGASESGGIWWLQPSSEDGALSVATLSVESNIVENQKLKPAVTELRRLPLLSTRGPPQQQEMPPLAPKAPSPAFHSR
jgi:hypothetical protein